MWIKNFSLFDIYSGYAKEKDDLLSQFDAFPDKFVLIQIFDPASVRDVPQPFKSIEKCNHVVFEFLDIECNDPLIEEFGMTNGDAVGIREILAYAKHNNLNVIVHCHAGICRSGAVVEFAVRDLGFPDPMVHRQPNMHVLHQLQKANGTYKDKNYYEGFFNE